MKYTEFLHTIETEITARLDNNFKLTIHPVKKNNGMIYDGLVIINPKFNIAPTIYLNPYYHWYLDGVSIDSILDAILSTYNDFKPTEDFDISFCDDFQGKGENNFPAHKLRQKPKAAKGRALYQISGFCHHI